MTRAHNHAGFALVTGLILLGVLTLVGLYAMRNTGLEVRMSENNAQRVEMFEMSESSRTVLGPVLDEHVFSRGWPVSISGLVPNELFGMTLPAGLTIATTSGSPPPDWFGRNPETSTTGYVFQQENIDIADATFTRTITPSGATPLQIDTDLAVYKLRVDIAPGAGAAMVAGYEGVGKAAAAGGGNMFFYTQSIARGPEGESESVTGAVYRHVITN